MNPKQIEETYWWCPRCCEECEPIHVTYEENHDKCGHRVELITQAQATKIDGLEQRLSLLTAALEKIRDSNHIQTPSNCLFGHVDEREYESRVFNRGIREGHRCCAEIARAALAKEGKCPKE